MTEADYEEAHEHKDGVWDKIFASMGQGNAKWATGDIKRAMVEEMAESDSETEEASEPVSDDWVANEIIDHTDKADSEVGLEGPDIRESYRVNWRGVAKHNLGSLQDDNGWFLADELCQTEPLLVQKYEEKLIIEADNGPVLLMIGVQAKSDADFPLVDNSRAFNAVAGENTCPTTLRCLLWVTVTVTLMTMRRSLIWQQYTRLCHLMFRNETREGSKL
jgi:hypothetical protein